jgi:hypothetical protein
MKSLACDVEFPESFAIAAYDEVNMQVAKMADPNDATAPEKKNIFHVFASAWNGVGYRLVVALDYDREFRVSIAKSTAPPTKERLIQERALFGCLASALSSVECFFMATYAVGAAMNSPSFPILSSNNLEKYPKNIAKALAADYPTSSFTKLVNEIDTSPKLKQLMDLRNVLAHRGILPRRHFLSNVADKASAVPVNPKALATEHDYAAELSDQTTRIHTEWVLESLNRLVVGLNGFIPRLEKTTHNKPLEGTR